MERPADLYTTVANMVKIFLLGMKMFVKMLYFANMAKYWIAVLNLPNQNNYIIHQCNSFK